MNAVFLRRGVTLIAWRSYIYFNIYERRSLQTFSGVLLCSPPSNSTWKNAKELCLTPPSREVTTERRSGTDSQMAHRSIGVPQDPRPRRGDPSKISEHFRKSWSWDACISATPGPFLKSFGVSDSWKRVLYVAHSFSGQLFGFQLGRARYIERNFEIFKDFWPISSRSHHHPKTMKNFQNPQSRDAWISTTPDPFLKVFGVSDSWGRVLAVAHSFSGQLFGFQLGRARYNQKNFKNSKISDLSPPGHNIISNLLKFTKIPNLEVRGSPRPLVRF